MGTTEVTYPPLDFPKLVTDGVWVVDSGPIHAFGLPLPVRMTVIRLPGGGLMLHSPTRFAPALHDALAALGPIQAIVLPSFAHWIFAQGWQKAEPSALTWAAPGMRNRSQIRRGGLRLDGELGPVPPPAWAGAIDHVIVPGALGFHEVAMLHQPSRTLVLTDIVQNVEGAKLPRPARLFLTAVGAADSERAPVYLRALVKLGGTAAREAGRSLVALRPERVIFSHGAWFDTDAAERLRRSLGWLTA